MRFVAFPGPIQRPPPALAALSGAKRRFLFWKRLLAFGVVGILVPSTMAMHPLSMSIFSVIFVEFVLRGAREREVGFELPDLFFGKEFGLRYMLLISVDTSSIVFLESPHDIYVDSERIVDSSARIGHGNDFGSEFR